MDIDPELLVSAVSENFFFSCRYTFDEAILDAMTQCLHPEALEGFPGSKAYAQELLGCFAEAILQTKMVVKPLTVLTQAQEKVLLLAALDEAVDADYTEQLRGDSDDSHDMFSDLWSALNCSSDFLQLYLACSFIATKHTFPYGFFLFPN